MIVRSGQTLNDFFEKSSVTSWYSCWPFTIIISFVKL